MKSVVLVIAIVLLLRVSVQAQTCCSGGVPLSANIGLPASEAKSFQFSLSYDFNRLKTLQTGDRELDDQRRERLTHSVLLETGYTINSRFSLDLFLSFIRQERNIFTAQGTNATVTNGVGDGVLLIKYNFTPINSQTSFQIGLGPKFPLGTTDKTADAGFALPADLQPGSGSWDMVYWATFSKALPFRQSMSVALTSTYRATGVNNDYLGSIEYEFGNEFQVIAGLADRLIIKKSVLDPSISLRYRKAKRDINNSVEIDATGGEWVFLMPGLKYSPQPNISLNLSMEFPIYAFVNNTQLTPTNRFTLGILYKIKKKEIL